MAAGTVEFRLSDGTSLTVPDADLNGVYEALWAISDRAGAISTAALLLDASQTGAWYRRAIELNLVQSNALRHAVDSFANPS